MEECIVLDFNFLLRHDDYENAEFLVLSNLNMILVLFSKSNVYVPDNVNASD